MIAQLKEKRIGKLSRQSVFVLSATIETWDWISVLMVMCNKNLVKDKSELY
jgi:hypothetical protein